MNQDYEKGYKDGMIEFIKEFRDFSLESTSKEKETIEGAITDSIISKFTLAFVNHMLDKID